MKHVNYLSFFLLTLFSISFISCSDDDDNKLNTGITNQSWTEGKSLEISQDNELSVSFNAAAKWVAACLFMCIRCAKTADANGLRNFLTINHINTAMQNVPFQPAKGGLSGGETWSFAAQDTAFRKTASQGMPNRRHQC